MPIARLILPVLLLLAMPATAQPVARLAAAFGDVAVQAPGAADFAAAASGSGLAPGSLVRTGPGSRGVLVLAGLLAALEATSEVEILPEGGPALVLRRGALAVLLREAPLLEVATPRGLAGLDGPGRFLVEAGDAARPTRLVVLAGKARLATEAGTIPLDPGQAGLVPPQGLGRMGPAGGTPALVAWLSGEAPPAPPAMVAAPVPLPVPIPAPIPGPAPPSVVVVIEEPAPYPWPVIGGWGGLPVAPYPRWRLPPVPPVERPIGQPIARTIAPPGERPRERPVQRPLQRPVERPVEHAGAPPPPARPATGPASPPALMTVIPPRNSITGR